MWMSRECVLIDFLQSYLLHIKRITDLYTCLPVIECGNLQLSCNEPSDMEFNKLTWSVMPLLVFYSYNDEMRWTWHDGGGIGGGGGGRGGGVIVA